MLNIKTNAKELGADLRRIPSKIKSAYKQSLREIAQRGKALAQSLAPAKSGELRRGIHYRVVGDKAELFSVVNSAFPYNFWVNQTEPFRVLHFKRRNRFFRSPQNVAYGKSALSPSGHRIAWTGTPGFFDIAAEQMDAELIVNMGTKIGRAMQKG